MQISKTFLTLCAVAVCATTALQARQDTDEQAKAREALRKKLAELEGKPAPEAPKAAAPTTPAPAATPAPVAPAPATDEQAEKLREAVRKKINELNAGEAAPAPVAPAPKPAAQPKPQKQSKPAPVVETKPAPRTQTDAGTKTRSCTQGGPSPSGNRKTGAGARGDPAGSYRWQQAHARTGGETA